VRLQVAGQLWLLVLVACALLCGAYLGGASPETARGWFFLQGGRLSCAATLTLLPGLVGLGAAAWLRSRHVLAWLLAVLWTLLLLAVYVDTRIYGLFRYHFNGLVWNVLTTPGGEDTLHLSTTELVSTLAVTLALIPLQAGAFLGLWRWALARSRAQRPTPRAARPGLAWGLVLVPNMLAVAAVYARADLQRDPQVMAYARVYPLYPRLTVKRIAVRYFGMKMNERPRVDLPGKGILLDYPRAEVHLPADGPSPNLLVVVIDSLRSDMLEPEVTPRLDELARESRTFSDHLSSGNATRFGLFGLIYGLHGSYWHPVCDENRSPVLVDALLERGYETRVFSSVSMDFPEFRSTAWVRMEERVEDSLHSTRPGARDDGTAQRFEQWMAERDSVAPFFAFVLIDAPHQSYFFPEDCAVFRPYVDDIAYGSIAGGASASERLGLLNRYKNAVHYADQVSGRLLDALRAAGHAEDTLVLVTGDHGEEFFENGFWGHTSNFTDAQVHVPLLLHGPGIPPGEETRPTSHIDVPATLLELLGADPAQRGEWTLGASLLDPPAARARVVSGWATLGVHVPGAILEVPFSPEGGIEVAVYDPAWKRIFDDSAILQREGQTLGRLILECRRFLR